MGSVEQKTKYAEADEEKLVLYVGPKSTEGYSKQYLLKRVDKLIRQ